MTKFGDKYFAWVAGGKCWQWSNNIKLSIFFIFFSVTAIFAQTKISVFVKGENCEEMDDFVANIIVLNRKELITGASVDSTNRIAYFTIEDTFRFRLDTLEIKINANMFNTTTILLPLEKDKKEYTIGICIPHCYRLYSERESNKKKKTKHHFVD